MSVSRPRLPRWIVVALAVAVTLLLLPFSLLAWARAVRSGDAKVRLLQDMANQPRYNPQALSSVFADRRVMRPNVPGTIARGQLWDDDHYHRGKVGGDWAKSNPVPITEVFVRRGQERFNIYCSACHGLTGMGDGPVHRRAVQLVEAKWIPPTSLVGQQVRERPDGHIFGTITNGIRNMPAYGPQILAEDRWAIVAYVRVLQLSRDASIDDVPPTERYRLK